MTERLYYTDSHTLAFAAHVVANVQHNGHPAVILDRTFFYPEGGGQPCDTGTINGVAVVDVQTQPETLDVLHVLAEPLTAEGVTCEINRARRLDHMQHHTGQHILTQAFVSIADAHTVSFHLSPDSVTIDLDKANLSVDVLNAVEDLANHLVLEDRPVTARLADPDDVEGIRMRKMPGYLATDGLRVVEVQGFDSTACGGTHVARTGEIGQIRIIRTEKYKGGTRVEFRCGGRALADYRARQAVTAALAADFSAAFTELPQLVGKLRTDLREAQKAL
ncbi:MAG: alanyl-tRNA editing protein [Anaerolineae bacterium]|nr:alanyl-tRNA editing protein [Anaerolineae bacterium]